MTRRRDQELRDAIDEVKSSIDKRSLCDIYEKTLAQTMRITRAQFGILFSFSADEEALSLIPIYGYESADLGNEAGRTLKVLELKEEEYSPQSLSLWRQAFMRGEPIFDTAPYIPQVRSALPKKVLVSQQVAFLPILNRGSCDTLIALSSEAELSISTLHRLWPLLNTSAKVRNSLLSDSHVFPIINREPVPADTSYEDLFKNLQSYSYNAVITTNSNCTILSANRMAKMMLCVSDDFVLSGRPLSDFLSESFANELQVRTGANNPLDEIKNRYFPSRWKCKTLLGRELTVNMTFFRYMRQGEYYNVFVLEDKTELLTEQHIREVEERRFLAVADLIPIGVMQTNERWECEYVNNAWCELAGLDPEDMKGLGWVNSIHESDSHRVLEELHSHINRGHIYEETCRFNSPMGTNVWVDLSASPFVTNEGLVEGFIITANDVTLHRVNEERLRKVAHYDSLTKLANRALLNERLRHLITRLPRTKSCIAVLYVDLDGFKNVNDCMGHDCGDLILVEVAKRLTHCVRQSDTVARIGGDEFTIVLEDVEDACQVTPIARKLVESIAQPYLIREQEIFLTTSIGITLSRHDEEEANQLLKQADIALYQAKADGKNNFQFYSEDLGKETHEKLSIANQLHRALHRQEFQVYYQPQADVKSGEIKGFEALLRWFPNHAASTDTEQVIAVLEETGLILGVGRWIISQAFQDYKQWRDAGLIRSDCHLSINLSPRQFRDNQLLPSIAAALKQFDIPANNIVFEITETLLLGDTRVCGKLMRDIKELGAKIALDDFGTGFSSLSHIKNFPIDTIKIDKSFVQDVLTDSEGEAIVRAVLAMSASLNKFTVAEGVDEAEKLERLQNYDCDLYQGYLLAKPLSAEAIVPFLDSYNARLAKNNNLPICS